MKRIIFLLAFTLFIGGACKLSAQRAIGLHPFDKELSIRTNQVKKNFWDYRLSFDFGYMEGYGYVKYGLEVIWNRRIVNKEQLKFYYGGGLAVNDFVPKMFVPLGIEVFPIESANFSFAVEVRPTFNFANFIGADFSSDIAFRYYF